MKTHKMHWQTSARIIWAITLKDIKEAVINKTTLMVIFSALLVAVAYRGLPLLAASTEPTRVYIHNPGESTLPALLENHGVFDIQTYPTQEAMQDRLREEEIPALGLAIPEGFDRSIETGEALVLQGYVLHWLSTREAVGLRAAVEAEINSLVGKGVQINTAGNVVYLEPESGGLGVQAAMGVVFVLMMIAISLIPHLFMEEKQSRTLEALLVSPARTGEVVVAKALVGLHYGGLGALAALLLNHSLVLHWPLALLTAACGGLFVVSIGLWLGLRVETRAQLGLWTWVLILPLLFPLIIFLLDDLMPAALVQASRWIPTTMVFNALRASFAGTLPLGTTLLQLGYVLIWTGAILGLVAWQVRSQDRETEASWAQRLRRALAPAWMRRSEQAAAHPVADRSAVIGGQPPAAPRPAPGAVLAAPSWETRPPHGWQIILTIAAKDARDLIRNKLAISILLGASLLALPNALLPHLLRSQVKPMYVFYEENPSQLVRTLAGRPEFNLRVVDSEAEMVSFAAGGMGPVLILKIPADFDTFAGSGEVLRIEGRYVHWSDAEEIHQLADQIADQLSQAGQFTVQVDLAGGELYPSLESGGFPVMTAVIIFNILAVIGMALVPLLMIEEKEAHTFDAMLVSPARYTQIVAGKALVGLVYCLIAAAVLLTLYNHFFVHWGVVILAVLVTSAFTVALGLLLGIMTDNAATTGVWGGALLLAMISTVVLAAYATPDWPAIVRGLVDWMPGSLMADLFKFAMLRELPYRLLSVSAAALAGMTLGIYLLLAWRVNRWERR